MVPTRSLAASYLDVFLLCRTLQSHIRRAGHCSLTFALKVSLLMSKLNAIPALLRTVSLPSVFLAAAAPFLPVVGPALSDAVHNELVFSVGVTAYLLFSYFFTPLKRVAVPGKVMTTLTGRFPWYLAFSAQIGLVLPVAVGLYEFYQYRATDGKNDFTGSRLVAPHTVLLANQVISEMVAGILGRYVHVPLRIAIPLIYNARRLFALWTWVQQAVGGHAVSLLLAGQFTAALQSLPVWPPLAALGVANLLFWSYNGLWFLPHYGVAGYFERYFQELNKKGDKSKGQ